MKSKKKNYLSGKKQIEKKLEEVFLDLEKNLDSLLRSKKEMKSIASNSYNHLNGFSKIVLQDDEKRDIKLRLHLWTEKPKTPEMEVGDAHDHRWSYVSIPLFGEFKETRYKERPVKESRGNDKKIRYKCFSRGKTEWLNLERFQEVRLEKVEENTRIKGELYYCKAGQIHTIHPSKYPAATLVMTFEPKRSYARVYRKKVETDDFMKLYAPNLNSKDVKKAFAFVKDKAFKL
jgi:hypothetical protein